MKVVCTSSEPLKVIPGLSEAPCIYSHDPVVNDEKVIIVCSVTDCVESNVKFDH